MDFIIIYSSYSQACNELFVLYPNLYSKGICADSKPMRALLAEKLNVLVVPTLLVVAVDSVLQRVIGLDNIKNWLWLTSTQLDSVRMESSPPSEQQSFQSEITLQDGSMRVPEEIQQVTSLDTLQDDIMPPSQDVSYALKSAVSLKSTAEELQRERDSFMESLKKQKT